MERGDIGGVHVKYLYHCHRQLWLYARGIRPEHLSGRVQLGEAVHETSYTRTTPVDLGAAKLDYLDGDLWVHEVKSSSRPTQADEAQALHYCLRLHEVGVDVKGAVLHYPATRRTKRIVFDGDSADRASTDVGTAMDVVHSPDAPSRIARSKCVGCSFTEYCWSE